MITLALSKGRIFEEAVPLLAAYVATFFGYWFGAVRLGEPAKKQ